MAKRNNYKKASYTTHRARRLLKQEQTRIHKISQTRYRSCPPAPLNTSSMIIDRINSATPLPSKFDILSGSMAPLLNAERLALLKNSLPSLVVQG